MSENDIAVEAAVDYDLVQFVADIGETTRESVQRMHARVCELIAGGRTVSAAIQTLTEELEKEEG